jgi:hypothetical protein
MSVGLAWKSAAKIKTISGPQMGSQLLQNTEIIKQTDVLLWKIWKIYMDLSCTITLLKSHLDFSESTGQKTGKSHLCFSDQMSGLKPLHNHGLIMNSYCPHTPHRWGHQVQSKPNFIILFVMINALISYNFEKKSAWLFLRFIRLDIHMDRIFFWKVKNCNFHSHPTFTPFEMDISIKF